MKLIRGMQNLALSPTPTVITIGNFDGFHRGHQNVIQQVTQYATHAKITSSIISFNPTPNEYFSQYHNRPIAQCIYPLRDKLKHAKKSHIDQLICLPFNQYLAELSAEQFVKRILVDRLQVQHLIIGDDFCFGRGRKGNFELLKLLGKHYHFTVNDTQTLSQDHKRISSTAIRNLLAVGNISLANQLLGHAYQLTGRIRQGDKRGRTIGFPTINLRLPSNIVTAKGVYVVRVHGLSKYPLEGIANLGSRPTVAGKEVRLETHIFDFNQSVYGCYVSIELKQMIRSEKKFDDFQQLLEQIKRDVRQAKQYFAQ